MLVAPLSFVSCHPVLGVTAPLRTLLNWGTEIACSRIHIVQRSITPSNCGTSRITKFNVMYLYNVLGVLQGTEGNLDEQGRRENLGFSRKLNFSYSVLNWCIYII